MFRTRIARRAASLVAARLLPVHRTAAVAPAATTTCMTATRSFHTTMVCRVVEEGGEHKPIGLGEKQGKYLINPDDVAARVIEVVKNFEKVDAAKVTKESHFINDLGLDSLDVVEIVMALEQEFILDIPDHDAEKIQSIPEAIEYIASNPMSK